MKPTAMHRVAFAAMTAAVLVTDVSVLASVTDDKVETQLGRATLTGVAKNAAEGALATKQVGDIQGVNSVNNETTIGSLVVN
jgi:osmotically-inducible protein OsmY